MIKGRESEVVDVLCLACNEPIKFAPYIDPEAGYDGHVVCQECMSLLNIKLVKSKVQKYSIEKINSKVLVEVLKEMAGLSTIDEIIKLRNAPDGEE